jgi:polysaccharide biosynthesis protein PslG
MSSRLGRILLHIALLGLLLAPRGPVAAVAYGQSDAGDAPSDSSEPADTPTPTPAPTATATPTPAPQPRSGFTYGTQLRALSSTPLARAAGFNAMWAYISWRALEPVRGQFLFEQKDRWGATVPNDLTNALNVARDSKLGFALRLDDPPPWAGGAVYRLDPSDVEDYVYHAVRYGGGRITYVEVFNEMNLPGEWGTSPPDPAAYARILAGAYAGAKRANPSVQVVSAGPSQRTGGLGGTMEDVDWLKGLYQAGAAGSFDLLGMHAYLGSFDPTTDPSSCTPMCFRDIELYRAVMEQQGDGQKSAFITEMGALQQAPIDLGEYAWMALAPDQRADYLVRALRMGNANYPWLNGAMVFNLDYAAAGDIPSTSERYWFSMLNADHTPRPAYTRISQARASGLLP